jgi:hypothetical protein
MVEVLVGLQPGESVVTSGRQTAQSVPQPIAENMT